MWDRFLRVLLLAGVVSACWTSAAAATGPGVVGSVSNATSLSGAIAVAVSGNDAYVASYWSGQLDAIDISNPAAPRIVGSTPSAPSMIAATNITISGHYAFVTSKNRNGPCLPGPIPACSSASDDDGSGNSLTVVDIADPTKPTVVGTLHDATNLFGAYSVTVSGNFAYVASQGVLQRQPQTPRTSTGSFSVIDITNPTGPTLLKTVQNSSLTGAVDRGLDHATSVAVTGHVAFVTAFYSQRLTAIDISNPNNPVVVSSLHDATNLSAPNEVTVVGGYAYVVNETGSEPELAVVNISNPAALPIAATISDPRLAFGYRIKARGNFVYVSATNAASVSAVDIARPTAPVLDGAVTNTVDLANVSGIDLSTDGRYIVAASPDLPGEGRPLFPPYPLQGGPTAIGTVSVIGLAPSPSLSSAPKITGTAQQGKTLSAAAGTWSGAPAPTFSYQWQRCNGQGNGCKAISNQTKTTYRVTAADVGSRLAVVVTGKNANGSASATAPVTKVVKWSSGSLAGAKLVRSRTATPGLTLSVPSVGGGRLLLRVAISLPKGLSFTGSQRALAGGLRIKSRMGKILRFKLSLKHGQLTVTLRAATPGATLTLARGHLAKAKSRAKSPKLRVSLYYKGTPVRSGSVKLRLA